MSGTSPRYIKLALAFGFGVATVYFVSHWYRDPPVFGQDTGAGPQQQQRQQQKQIPNRQSSGPSRTYVLAPQASAPIQKKQTKCGETDDDFKLAGNEGVKPLTERVAAKFRSKDASCSNSYNFKANTQLTPEETKGKQECLRTWAADHKKGAGAFWAGNTQYVRHTHHTYLNAESVVFDIGGNKGEDADAMIKKFHPGNYVILEPIKTLYSNLVNMFKSDNKIILYNFGLARKNDKVYVNVLGHGGDATSIFAGNDQGGNCLLRLVNTTHFLLQMGVPCYEVDLITVNCEGCEFEIMEELINSGLINQFRHVQFATHPTLKHLQKPAERYCEIQERLKRTHVVTYQYKWCWESWKRKDLK